MRSGLTAEPDGWKVLREMAMGDGPEGKLGRRPEVVFFDAAGTLIRLARPVGEVYAGIAAHYGAEASASEVGEGFRRAWKAMSRGGAGRFSKGWWREVVWRSFPEEVVAEPFPFDDYFEEVFRVFARPDLWRVYPEVEGVLDRLEGVGVRRAVLSNWDGRLREILGGWGLAERFEWIGISEELGVAKPEVEIFRRAEVAVGVAGDGLWMVGDDAEADVRGAEAAGWVGRLVLRPDRNLEVVLEELWSMAWD